MGLAGAGLVAGGEQMEQRSGGRRGCRAGSWAAGAAEMSAVSCREENGNAEGE